MHLRHAPALLILATACAAVPPPAEVAAPAGAALLPGAPGATPELLAPGLVSTGLDERDTAWTPDGGELLYTVAGAGRGTIVRWVRGADGLYRGPELVPALGATPALEPFVTADGRWLYFASPRPLPGEDDEGDWNIWRAPRTDGDWGVPEPLPEPVNGPGDEFYPSLERDGTLYLTATRDDSLGGEDLYRFRPDGEGWSGAENLGPAVNSPGPEFNALVHPDGAWILFGSARAGDAGGGDLYVSFATPDGAWTPAQALPPPLSSPALDFCPALSPDGSLLFFTSRRPAAAATPAATFAEVRARLTGPGNGLGDIWVVQSSVLDQLRP